MTYLGLLSSIVFARQVQATVVGLLAAVAAVFLGALSKGYVELNQAAVLCASSLTTAFIAALSLGKDFFLKFLSFLRVIWLVTAGRFESMFLCVPELPFIEPGPCVCRALHLSYSSSLCIGSLSHFGIQAGLKSGT